MICRFLSVNHITILVTIVYLLIKCSSFHFVFPPSNLYECFAQIQLLFNRLFHFKTVLYLLFLFPYIFPVIKTYCLASILSLYWNQLLKNQEACNGQNQWCFLIHILFNSSEVLGNHDHYLLEIFFSLFCSILRLLLKHQCWLSFLRGLLKCVSMGFVYCRLLILNTPVGFIVFPPSFMEI